MTRIVKGNKSIGCTAWGNWYGYIGRRKVESFMNTPEASAEDNARAWLNQEPERHTPGAFASVVNETPICGLTALQPGDVVMVDKALHIVDYVNDCRARCVPLSTR